MHMLLFSKYQWLIVSYLEIPDFNYCEPNPCLNNGFCESVEHEGDRGFRCLCRPGFYGLKCESGKCYQLCRKQKTQSWLFKVYTY